VNDTGAGRTYGEPVVVPPGKPGRMNVAILLLGALLVLGSVAAASIALFR
jgi:hypothetical protein